jgi:hypothetical protein
MGSSAPTIRKVLGEGRSTPPISEASKNPFETLSNPSEIFDPIIEELEKQTLPPIVEKYNVEATQSEAPIGISSYVEMI